MAVSKKASRQGDRVAELISEVEALKARLAALEGTSNGSNGNGHSKAPQSRRDLLKVAGAAVAGAAGSVLLSRVPASAAAGTAMTLGVLTNDTNATTGTNPTGGNLTPPGSAPSPLFMATGQAVTPANAIVPATQSTQAPTLQSIPLIGAVGAGGSLPLIGNPAVPDYPGFAPIQGVGGQTTQQTAGGAKTYSEGVNGWGSGPTGIGVTGESDTGYGIGGGSGGIDIAALGNGRVLQVPLPGGPAPKANLLTNPPSGPPNYAPNDFEQVRDENGVIWISTPGGAWHRLNSVIPITPFRLYDSRPNARPANSITDIVVAGAGSIPANAVGVVGNLVAVNPPAAGFLTMFPKGGTLNNVTSLNFLANVTLSNLVVAALGTGGAVSVYVSGNGPANFTFDVTGYII